MFLDCSRRICRGGLPNALEGVNGFPHTSMYPFPYHHYRNNCAVTDDQHLLTCVLAIRILHVDTRQSSNAGTAQLWLNFVPINLAIDRSSLIWKLNSSICATENIGIDIYCNSMNVITHEMHSLFTMLLLR